MRLTGKRALVTGGGSGIGRAIALRFAEEGARVAVLDVNADAAKEVALEASGMSPDSLPVAADVRDDPQLRAGVEQVAHVFGGLDVLVNVAGISRHGSLAQWSEEDFDAIFAVNVKGLLRVTRAALPHLRASGRGVILNFASGTALAPLPGLGLYVASKAAVVGLTRVLALEEGRHGVRAIAICPGATETPMLFSGTSADEIQNLRGKYPLGRLGQPADLASAALFLASDEAGWVTGVSFAVDGGRALH